jgi:type 1 glutamine amidotransferase
MNLSHLTKLATALAGLILCLTLMSTIPSHRAMLNDPAGAGSPGPAGSAKSKPKVLIFSKTNGYHHACIPVGIEAIKKLGTENGFDVDATDDSLAINYKNLKQYKTLIFLCPTGKVFGPDEEKGLQEYIHHGGGFVGIHAAADCEYNFQWYGDLVGAYFKSHPKQQQAKWIVVDKNHPASKNLPDVWDHFDELYNYKYFNPDIKVLVKIDEKSYEGGANGDNHPMIWYHDFDGGRSFYTEMGHTNECYSDPTYLGMLLGGIQYAMGKK